MSNEISNKQRKRALRKGKTAESGAESVKVPSSNWEALKGKVAAKNPQYLKKRKRAPSPEETVESEPVVTTPTVARKEYKSSFMDVLDPSDAGPSSHADAGRYVAIDCEFVGVGTNGAASSLARVSIVNFHGHVLLDTFVRQKERVTDYRTWVSGVRTEDLIGAPTFEEVVKMVADMTKGRILVGHAIYNDLQVLLLSHPRASIRDTQSYAGIHAVAKSKRPGLRSLAKLVLGIDIQAGEHSSVEDARATMAIFRNFKTEWEASLSSKAGQASAARPKKPMPKASAIDPTRRYKQNRSLGLAAVVSAELPADEADDITLNAHSSESVAPLRISEQKTASRPTTKSKSTTDSIPIKKKARTPSTVSQKQDNWWEELAS